MQLDIPNHNAFIDSIEQIINMGGPWAGNLYIDHKLISHKCLVNNVIYDQDSKRLVYVKYHAIGKWQANNFFTINILEIDSTVTKQSIRHFPMVFVTNVYPKKLELVEAFHDKDLSTKQALLIEKDFITLINK